MTTPLQDAAPVGQLRQVRTIADAASWLRHRAALYLVVARNEPSQVRSCTLRKTAATLDAVAETVDRSCHDDVVAADELMLLARSYRQTCTADPGDQAADYQMACRHLADALGEVGARLTHATAPERARRAWVEPNQRPISQTPGL